MIYRKCTVCGCKIPQYTLCPCEQKKRLDNYRDYHQRRIQDEAEKERVTFYQSDEWEQCRNAVASHQFNLDLYEWSKGEVIQADLYHHVIEVRDSTEDRIDIHNIIGLTQGNHNKIHAYMNKGFKQKRDMQNKLMDILERFENEYY